MRHAQITYCSIDKIMHFTPGFPIYLAYSNKAKRKNSTVLLSEVVMAE